MKIGWLQSTLVVSYGKASYTLVKSVTFTIVAGFTLKHPDLTHLELLI
jgi:hypothetical protein